MVAISLALSPCGALAAGLDLTAETVLKAQATVGLDKNTTDLINGLPSEIRSQMLIFLQQAMPIIDTSVEKYIATINDDINSQIDNLQCSLVGTGAALVGTAKSALPLAGPYAPIEDIQTDHAKIIASFSSTNTPAQYLSAYEDLIVRATITACAVKLVPEALDSASKIQQDTRSRWSAWNRSANNCTDAFSCFDWLHDNIEKVIAASDARDVSAVRGSDRLKSLTRPAKPGFFDKWDPTAAEADLNEMFSISEGIDAAKTFREAKAQATEADASNYITLATQAMNTARASLSPTIAGNNDAAITYANYMTANGDTIKMELNSAVELMPSLKDDAAKLNATYQTIVGQQQPIINSANTNKAVIAQNQKVRPIGGDKPGPGAKN